MAAKKVNRREILDTSRNQLVNKGMAQLSIRGIARGVGCSVGSIYVYFENKDVLVHALIEEGFEKLHEHLRVVAQAVKPATDRLTALCRAYIHFGQKNPEYYEIMYNLNAKQMSRFPAEKYRKARRTLEFFSDSLRDLPALANRTRESVYLNTSCIWAFVHGAVSLMIGQRLDKRLDEDAFIEETIERIASMLHNLQAPEQGVAA